MSKPWSKKTLEERIEAAIRSHRTSIEMYTEGKGITHELYVDDKDGWLMMQGHSLCISTLQALLDD